ncbi:MAG: metallophosphoesterase family protein [Chlorobi bacterium]|nr:metallophosphoesterase family protein [Chlorobiota bacterium]
MIKSRIKISILLLSFLFLFCSENPKSVKDVIDKAVTHIYQTMNKEEIKNLTNDDVIKLFTDDELKILATKYWMFDVNVPVIVSVMRSEGQAIVPFWLTQYGFKKTDLVVKNKFNTFEVWQKEFPAGRVGLGISGFDGFGRHYFVSVQPVNKNDKLILSNFFPENQYVGVMDVGAFTYHDWDELVLTEVPESLKGGQLLTTIRGRATEAHLLGAFRDTPFPSSEKPDQIMLTWSKDPKTTQSIQWRTNTSVKKGVVRYWLEGYDEQSFSEVAAEIKVIEDRLLENDRYINRYTTVIENLKPGTKYNYKVGDPETNNWSSIAEFITAPESPAPFSFVYFGDTHRSPFWGKLINDAYKRFPNTAFYTIGGDIVSTGLHRDEWDQLFGYSADVIKNRPLMPALGNHDDQNGLGAGMFTDLFDLPKNGPANLPKEYLYSFEYSDALFIMLAIDLPIREQTAWLEEQLKNSNAKWKFAIFHFPPYVSVDNYPVIRKEWGDLFDKYHVDIVFSGHVHYYMRSKPMYAQKPVKSPAEGTIYVISIAIPNTENPTKEEDYVQVRIPKEYFYQKIDINGNELKYNAYNSEGKIMDSFNIKK